MKFEKVRLITGPCSDNVDYVFVRINGTHVRLPHFKKEKKKKENERTKDQFPSIIVKMSRFISLNDYSVIQRVHNEFQLNLLNGIFDIVVRIILQQRNSNSLLENKKIQILIRKLIIFF